MKKLSKAAAIKHRLTRPSLISLAAAALALSSGCASPCDNELISTNPSPDGRVKAVVFIRACGATTPIATEMSIVPARDGTPVGWANALTISDDPDHPMQRSSEAIEVRLKWNSPDRLSVRFPRSASVGKRAEEVRGVHIEYDTF